MVSPNVETPVMPEIVIDRSILPPYIVILHNDDRNSMEHVIHALVESVPGISIERAAEIMMEAHSIGRAVVVTSPLELAELYRERLEGYGLTATIEKS